jgi:hypothetical protein
MKLKRKHIFQYVDPTIDDNNEHTRWIASDTKADADAFALERRWQNVHGGLADGHEILEGHKYVTPRDYFDAGVDVIISAGGWRFTSL